MGFGDILKGASGILTGGLGGLAETIVSTVAGQFPEKMNEQEKAQLELQVKQVIHEQEVKMLGQWNDQEKQFQSFINEHEGSASDLKSIPILGHILLFLRGAFRPIMAFGVLYTDLMVFSGSWNIAIISGDIAPQVMSLLWIVNLVVLTFYFGERAIKNLAPLIEKMFLGK